MNHRTPLAALSVVLPLLLSTACSDDGDGDDAPTPTPAATPSPTATGTPTPLPTPSGPPAPTPTPTPTPAACGDGSPAALGACVERALLEADLATVAHPRPHGSAHWQTVQDLCATRLTELGYDVELAAYGRGVNVIGRREGTGHADELVVLGAHYDSVPGCDGADDNGSGVAGLLEAARVLARVDHDRTLVIACWDEEELGLIGSDAWVAEAARAGARVVVNLNFEMIGYASDAPGSQTFPPGFDLIFPAAGAALAAREGRGDFLAVIAGDDAAPSTAALVLEGRRVGLPVISLVLDAGLRGSPVLSDLRRSDHAPFWAEGYPGIQLTDSANFRNPYYHCAGGPDAVETLDFDFATRVVKATAAAAAAALQAGARPEPPSDPLPTCDVVAQDCEGGQHCSVRFIERLGYRATCVPGDGTKAVGESCTRTELGLDECAAGGICTFWGLPAAPEGESQPRHCLQLCDDESGCPEGSICRRVGFHPTAGACVPSCNPLAGAEACGEGLRCSPLERIDARTYGHACDWIGARAAAGEACTASAQCDHGLWCVMPERRCRPLCDATRPCEGGADCVPLAEPADGALGTCN